MPNYTLYATPVNYNPVSFLEMWTPVQAANEYHQQVANQYDELEMQAATLEKLADSAIDLPQYQLYKDYADLLRQAANDLATYGAVGAQAALVRSALSKSKKDYAGQIQPIMDAYANRQKQIELYDKMYANDPYTQFSFNPRETGLGLYMVDSPTLYQVSGTDTFNRGVAAGKLISSNMIKLNARYGDLFASFFKEDGSISVETMQTLADSGDKDAQAIIDVLNETTQQMKDSSDYNYLTNEGKDKIDANWWQGVNTGWIHDLDRDIRNMPDDGISRGTTLPSINTINELTDTLPVVELSTLGDLFKDLDTGGVADIWSGGIMGKAPDIVRMTDNGPQIDEDEWNASINDAILGRDNLYTLPLVVSDIVTATYNLTSSVTNRNAAAYYTITDNKGNNYNITLAVKNKADDLLEILSATNPEAYEKLTSNDPEVRHSVNIKQAVQTAIKNYLEDNYDKGLVQHKVRLTDNQTQKAVGSALQTALQQGLVYEYGVDSKLKTYSKGKQFKESKLDLNAEIPVSMHWLGGDNKYIAVTLENKDNKKQLQVIIPANSVSDQLGEALQSNNALQVLFNSFKNKTINGTKVGEFRSPDRSKPTSKWSLMEKLYFKIEQLGGILNATRDKFTDAEWQLLNLYVALQNALTASYTGFVGALIGNTAVGALGQNIKVSGSGEVKP